MTTFTIGQTVKSNKSNFSFGLTEGRHYKVIDTSKLSLRIENDRGTVRWLPFDYFEPTVAEKNTKPPVDASKHWIIAVIVDGQPQPAPHPRTYDTQKQAHAVAKSMAEKIPGQTFVVYEATGFTHVPTKVSTEVYAL
jgi:hypothetical protein